ncbi:H-NS family nucleoid-associated regulatory protein [Pseudoduganella danionis]|nr:H-NS histone family protein [Pseudoduganella danionis]
MSTYAELQAQIKKLQEQAEQVKAKELETVIAEIKKKISEYDLTAEQLGFASTSKKTTKKATAKDSTVMYKNGDLTWSGATRGRKPDWVKEILEAGGDIEEYRVK